MSIPEKKLREELENVLRIWSADYADEILDDIIAKLVELGVDVKRTPRPIGPVSHHYLSQPLTPRKKRKERE